MKTKQIEFNGKFFNARIIKDRNNQELIIAGLDLKDTLIPYDFTDEVISGYINAKAMQIDDTIFYYVSEDCLKSNDEKLKEELIECNPDFVEFL